MRLISSLCVILAYPVAAEKISLNEISSYFNDMITAEAQFSQFSDTGETTTGRLYIRRPGRIRFEYDPPDATLVVVGGGQVAVFDPKSRDEPLRFPLRHSPLNLVLEREVDLAQRDMVAHGEVNAGAGNQDQRRPAPQQAADLFQELNKFGHRRSILFRCPRLAFLHGPSLHGSSTAKEPE